MLTRNHKGWVMPASFEDYAQHFREAQDAWTRLFVAIDQVVNMAAQLRDTPTILAGPVQPWPTQQELHQMFAEAQGKTGPLAAEHSQLSQDAKTYAPKPNTASLRPGGRR
jgi:hypothetical protein